MRGGGDRREERDVREGGRDGGEGRNVSEGGRMKEYI